MNDEKRELSQGQHLAALEALNTHKAELEIQNEELRQSREELERSRHRYFRLFDLAPVGYLTLNDQNVILEANIKACNLLGHERNHLLKQKLTSFIDRSSQSVFAKHRSRVLEVLTPQSCELLLVRKTGHTFWGQLDMSLDREGLDDGPVIRIVVSNIDDRKKSDQALKHSEARLRNLLNKVSAVAVQGYHADGTVHFWNKASERLYGYSAREAEGRNLLDLIIPPEKRTHVAENINRMFTQQRTTPAEELLLMHKDGSKVPVFSNHAIIQPHGQEKELYCIDIDLTPLKEAERKIKHQRDMLKCIFDGAPYTMLLLDKECRVHDINRAGLTFFQKTKKTVLGKHCGALFKCIIDQEGMPTPSDACPGCLLRQNVRIALDSGQSRLEEPTRLSVLKGTDPQSGIAVRDLLISTALVVADERRLALVTIADVTERVQIAEDLIQAKEAAEAASIAKSQFLANMSHELRTPLNGLLGMMQLLQTTELDAEQAEYVTLSIRSGGRLTRLLSDILDLSRIEARKLTLLEEPFHPEELIQAVTDTLGLACREKGLQLEQELSDTVPARLIGDAVRIRQILFNLVGNAIKFTDQGRIDVAVFALDHPEPTKCRLACCVSDTGSGILENQQRLVFGSFTQANESLTRKHQGAGLGLAIVKSLVELMDGTISIDSEPGLGATICCTVTVTMDAMPLANHSTPSSFTRQL
ncbi:MAG: PAS domain S-box protein [Desulfovibrionales bacterium]|nr:MAG: PAS domain S-box protein [Desulfovibrionales bacterium]